MSLVGRIESGSSPTDLLFLAQCEERLAVMHNCLVGCEDCLAGALLIRLLCLIGAHQIELPLLAYLVTRPSLVPSRPSFWKQKKRLWRLGTKLTKPLLAPSLEKLISCPESSPAMIGLACIGGHLAVATNYMYMILELLNQV